jgi:hypothetical protein
MTCPDPQQCLSDHIRPRLSGWADSATSHGQYHARCPAHDDHKASLSVTVGERGFIICHCHRKPPCTPADIRSALIRAGVPHSCLAPVRGQHPEDRLVSAILAILEDGPGPAGWLRIAAAVLNGGQIPHGADLLRTAARIRLSRRTAYRAAASVTASVTASANSDTPPGNLGSTEWSTPDTTATTNPQVRPSAPSVKSGTSRDTLAQAASRRVAVTRCELCGCELDMSRRADARFCGSLCRQKASRSRRRDEERPMTAPAGGRAVTGRRRTA